MNEFDIRLSDVMVSDLILRKRKVAVELDGKEGKYYLGDLTALTIKTGVAEHNKEKNEYIIFCTATKGYKNIKVKLFLTVIEKEIWYVGKIVFPRAPV